MSRITKDEIAKLAELAQLALSDDEQSLLELQLSAVLEEVAVLGELDTSGVRPMPYGIHVENVYQQDQRRASIDRERALDQAPQVQDGLVRVPRIID